MPRREAKSLLRRGSRQHRIRCPRAPDGGLSETTSTNVNTPRKPSRFGCPSTTGISIAIDSSSIFIVVDLHPVSLLPDCLRSKENASHPRGVMNSGTPRAPIAHRQLRQSPHPSHFVHRQNPRLQQDLLNLRFFQRIARVQFHRQKFKFQITSQPFPDQTKA